MLNVYHINIDDTSDFKSDYSDAEFIDKEELKSSSPANVKFTSGLERVDHKDLDSLDEPDGIQNASLEKGKLTNTRCGIRQRSGAFDNEAACDAQSVGRDSALSLNQVFFHSH